MNRRESLKLFALMVSAGSFPTVAIAAGGASSVAIYDGRFAEARAFARKAGQSYDCQEDAACLWFSHFVGKDNRKLNIAGLTSAADAMVLADCARREGLAFDRFPSSGQDKRLVFWTITGRSFI